MSFHTSLIFYRPTTPPLISGADLGRFVEQLRATQTLKDRGWQTLDAKFGKSIDVDVTSAVWTERISAQISKFKSISWDIAIQANGIQQIVDRLRAMNASSSRLRQFGLTSR
jgi:hypothetical protein